jgi:hypothetical protein
MPNTLPPTQTTSGWADDPADAAPGRCRRRGRPDREAARLLFASAAPTRVLAFRGRLAIPCTTAFCGANWPPAGCRPAPYNAGYPVRITEERLRQLGKRGRMLRCGRRPGDSPQTIHQGQGAPLGGRPGRSHRDQARVRALARNSRRPGQAGRHPPGVAHGAALHAAHGLPQPAGTGGRRGAGGAGPGTRCCRTISGG